MLGILLGFLLFGGGVETDPARLVERTLPLFPIRPVRAIELDLAEEPSYESPSPLYGQLALGDPVQRFTVAVDAPESRTPLVYVDTNHNGDLTDEPPLNCQRVSAAPGWWCDVILPVPITGDMTPLPFRIAYLPELGLREYVLVYQPRYQRTLPIGNSSITVQPGGANGLFQHPPAAGLAVNGHPASWPVIVGRQAYWITGWGGLGEDLALEATPAVPPATPLTPGQAAPEFTGPDVLGGPYIRLPDLRGKSVILDFFATWCGPCRETLPALRALRQARDPQRLVVIGVNLDGGSESRLSRAQLQRFLREQQIDWPVLFEGQGWASVAARQYGVTALPRMVLIDPTGNIQQLGQANDLRDLLAFWQLTKDAAIPAAPFTSR